MYILYIVRVPVLAYTVLAKKTASANASFIVYAAFAWAIYLTFI